MTKRLKNNATVPTDEVLDSEAAAEHLTPTQLFALTALAIFVGEALIMFVMPVFGEIPVALEAAIDAVLLTLLASPVLYTLLFRPMVLHIEERRRAERALLNLNTILERRVAERTEELSLSNKALNREVLERRATEERIRRTNDFIQRLIEPAPCLMATVDANTLRCNYVNGRVEDFLGVSPEDVAPSERSLLDTIVSPDSRERCRSMINDLTVAPQGEIARSELRLDHADGKSTLFRVGIVVVSRTAIGEAEEVLFVATPVDERT
jgi:PAS domain-containing protein